MWLKQVNQDRGKRNLRPVAEEEFELLIDRLEKESHFQAVVNGDDLGQSIDEDALCVICLDGECSNCNAILFCDMCNMAVHQECYGVPYVPEGKYLLYSTYSYHDLCFIFKVNGYVVDVFYLLRNPSNVFYVPIALVHLSRSMTVNVGHM